jgi:hypothetical protein
LYTAATEKGDVVAAMFLLKCRHNYNDRPTGVEPNSVSVVFQLPAPLDPSAYTKLLHAQTARPPLEHSADE